MGDIIKQRPNGVDLLSAVRYFNSLTLLAGASQVVTAGSSYYTPNIDIAGFTAFMLMVDINQLAGGGTTTVNLIHVDPETGVAITTPSTVLTTFQPGPVSGNTVNTTRRFTFCAVQNGTADVPLLCQIQFLTAVQNATLTNARLWCGSTY